jgi:hypothetical protein
MIGHGRPSSLALALARTAVGLCACLTAVAAAQNPLPAEPLQLRITWGSGEASRWLGRLSVDDGSLSDLQLLSPDADAPGSIWLEKGALQVVTLSAHKFDSIEVAAKSSTSAKLHIELAPADKPGGPPLDVPLADLSRRPYQVRLDDRGNTLEVQLIPPPPLRISPKRDPLIFAPGETCSFELLAAIPNLMPGTDLAISTTISASRRKETLAPKNDQRVAVPVDGHPKITLDVPLPNTEGVYTIHVAATRPSGFARVWSASTKLAERSFQVVVLDPNPPAPATGARWESVLEIDPTNPRWVERLQDWTQVRRIPGLHHGALGSTRASAVDLPLGRFIELPSTAPGADPHWQAYSLPLEVAGVPHMLEIDYPADAEQHFGISIVEPNAGGVISGLNRDAGVFVEGLGRSEAKQKQTQRLVFWPRTQSPLLVVTNLHPAAAAHFGPIRVYKRSANQLNTVLAGNTTSHNRLIAAYLARPTVAESMGASRSVDPSTAVGSLAAECVDDSETAYESATRLVDYLRYSGYNSAIVSVMPSSHSQPPAAKPLDVDGTELMLRVCDREGISLIPAIEFAAPIPQLETIRRSTDPHTSGLEWVGPDGRTWLETYGNRHGLAPYYNLLDPRVRQIMLQSVRDLAKLYGSHRAFAGLAVRLSSDGYAQLPPLEWGLDDATIGRFQRDSGIKLDCTGQDRFAARNALLTDKHADAWRSWRAAQVSAFYAELATLVRGTGDRRLVLTTENILAHPQLASRARPNLLSQNAGNRLVATLLDVGIDRQALERRPDIILCPTRYVEPTTSLPDCAPDLELNDAFALWRQASGASPTRAAMLYHRPVRQRLASFENARTPWRVAGEMQLVSHALPQGAAVRQPYLEAFLENDPAVLVDGGELLPLGEEDALREVRYVLAQLPTSAEVSQVAKQPIVVRTYTEPNRATFVAMNMSPWHCDARVSLDIPQSTALEPLTCSTADAAAARPIAVTAGRQVWPLSLAPYEVRAVRTSLVGSKVVDIQADLAETANIELATKLADLMKRDLTASRVYPALANPSFEPLGAAGQLIGWRLSGNDATAIAQLVATNPQDGQSCLYMRSGGQSAILESDLFPVPPTGQLAMKVYARGQNLAPDTVLRLIFEGEYEGQPYRRAFKLTAAELQRPDGRWGKSFAIFVDDLPLHSGGQMRIVFQLSGPGEVWLDNAVLYDLLFPLDFYGESGKAEVLQLNQQIFAAKSAFDTGQVSDCVRILDSYWPRFILAYRPPVQPKVVNGNPPAAHQALPPQPNQGQEPAPGISEHLKRFLPILR